MKKMTVLLFTALFSFASVGLSAYGNSPRWSNNYSSSVQEAKASSKPILILFTGSSWCPACMRLERDVLNKPAFAQAVSSKFVLYKAEFDQPSQESMMRSPDKALLDRYAVSAFPTMVVVDANGMELFKIPYKAGGAEAYAQEIEQRYQSIRR